MQTKIAKNTINKEKEFEFHKDTIINNVLTNLRNNLDKNEIFLSESDFKFTFAQFVKEYNADEVILEYPILTSKLYKNAPDKCKNGIKESYNCKNPQKRFESDRTFIDLKFKYNDNIYFVEFKYKLKCPKCNIERYGNSFSIRTQSAHNIGRYQFYEDIERMEQIQLSKKCRSFVIFITNDENYWNCDTTSKNRNKADKSDKNFQLKDKKEIMTNYDNGLAYLGGKKCKIKTGKSNYSRRNIFVANNYKIEWKEFKSIQDNTSKFNILTIECAAPH